MGRSDKIIEELLKYDSEREWFEFKENQRSAMIAAVSYVSRFYRACFF